ncbi:hypothetical protein Dimus_019119 [Dionaea muscipula]
MVQTLEAIKGGGGSIKVGTVGTISSLMTRELEPVVSSSHAHLPSRFGSRRVQDPVSFGSSTPKEKAFLEEAGSSRTSRNIKNNTAPRTLLRTRAQNHDHNPRHMAATPRQQKQKASSDEASSGGNSKDMNQKSPKFQRKYKRTHHIPILGAENIVLDKTPNREKHVKKGSNIVDIVDINCGTPSGSLASRLKKLGFSKLSATFI